MKASQGPGFRLVRASNQHFRDLPGAWRKDYTGECQAKRLYFDVVGIPCIKLDSRGSAPELPFRMLFCGALGFCRVFKRRSIGLFQVLGCAAALPVKENQAKPPQDKEDHPHDSRFMLIARQRGW